jgi:hypothetical protein
MNASDLVGKVLHETRRPPFLRPQHVVGAVDGKNGEPIVVLATWSRNGYFLHRAEPLDIIVMQIESGRLKIKSR